MGDLIGFLIFLVFGGTVLTKSVRIVNQGNEALVERLGRYNGRKLSPGLNFTVPFLDRIAYQQTVRERVIDIPPQQCITRDNVSISVDAVVYWRIMDLEKAYYKVENLQSAMVNLVLTQIRAEMGKLELDETFTARSEINELLLRDQRPRRSDDAAFASSSTCISHPRPAASAASRCTRHVSGWERSSRTNIPRRPMS